MVAEQLLLFEHPDTEMDHLWMKITEVETSQDKTRRRLFKEIRELNNAIVEMKAYTERTRAMIELSEV